MFPQLSQFAPLGFLLLRLMVGVIFITSGWHHLKDPESRSKSIGKSKNFTIFLGAGEVLGSLGIMFGVLTQLAAFGLILILLGAIYKKIFEWRIGFWGEKIYGWHYDLMLIVMNLVILHRWWALEIAQLTYRGKTCILAHHNLFFPCTLQRLCSRPYASPDRQIAADFDARGHFCPGGSGHLRRVSSRLL